MCAPCHVCLMCTDAGNQGHAQSRQAIWRHVRFKPQMHVHPASSQHLAFTDGCAAVQVLRYRGSTLHPSLQTRIPQPHLNAQQRIPQLNPNPTALPPPPFIPHLPRPNLGAAPQIPNRAIQPLLRPSLPQPSHPPLPHLASPTSKRAASKYHNRNPARLPSLQTPQPTPSPPHPPPPNTQSANTTSGHSAPLLACLTWQLPAPLRRWTWETSFMRPMCWQTSKWVQRRETGDLVKINDAEIHPAAFVTLKPSTPRVRRVHYATTSVPSTHRSS